jgi:NAD(P)-dependent dehydrogenase (short-subunit alcohol dehydrogenase family)
MRVLRDRVGVVTGAAGGIGSALVRELARSGMHLVLADIDEPGMDSLAREVEGLGRRCTWIRTDVRHIDQVERLLEHALSRHGSCHLAINNAGVFHAASLMDSAPAQWQRVIDVNLWGVIHGCRVFGRHFAAQHEGHIVNTASVAGLIAAPGMTAYSTTKFAVVGLSQQLRWELAADGVGVTVVCPGVVNTAMVRAPGVGLSRAEIDRFVRPSTHLTGLSRRVVRAVQRDRPLVRYGNDAFLVSMLRLLPAALVDPLGKRIAKQVLDSLRGPTTH